MNVEFATLEPTFSTANLADGCLRTETPFRVACGLQPLIPGSRIAGKARPVRHFGSVDILLEAIVLSLPGSVLVIDNQGRTDEGCIGDLIVQEAASSGLAGIVLWGCHRDTAELKEIGLPVFSIGASSSGPRRLYPRAGDALQSAMCQDSIVTDTDVVVVDDDGAVFVAQDAFATAAREANFIRTGEQEQARLVRDGHSLSSQLKLHAYLQAREIDKSLTFREHLARTGGLIEA